MSYKTQNNKNRKQFILYPMFNQTTKLLLVFALIFLSATVKAQQLSLNSTNVFIHNTATMYVSGDIKTTGTGLFNLDGELEFTGDLDHQGAPGAFTGDGTVVLSGGAQQLDGVQPIDFPSLVLNGAGDKTLLRSVSVGGSSNAGQFDLQQGTLVLNNFNLYIRNNAAAAINFSNGSIRAEDVDFNSNVYWYIGTAAGTHVVPFSNAAGVIIPMAIDRVAGDVDTVRFSTYATNPANNPLPNSPITVTHIRNTSGVDNSANTVDRFWLTQWDDPAALVHLRFNYATAEAPSNGNNSPKAQRWNPLNDGWDSPMTGQFNLSPYSVSVQNVGMPGVWAIAKDGSPLPITLLDFKVKANKNREVDLSWITLNEKDNDYFTIERSKNGIDFESVLQLDGAGTSAVPLFYSAVDKNPLYGRSYYRLRQTDFNGESTLTAAQSVYFSDGGYASVSTYPNPAVDQLTFTLEAEFDEQAELTLEIFTAYGQRAFIGSLQSLESNTEGSFSLPVSSFARGHYHYRILSDSEVLGSGKIILQ
jgi:hypothetical protein